MWPVAFLVALAIPATSFVLFDGLPFSRPLEFLIAALAAMVSVDGPMRRLVAGWIRRTRHARAAASALLIAVTSLKLLLLLTGSHGSFAACYRSIPANTTLTCERSYERWWTAAGPTRLDRTIAFAPGEWKLSFFNGVRFNYAATAGNPDRTHLPFDVDWTGRLDVPAGATAATATYTGTGTVWIGDRPVALPVHYGAPAKLAFAITPGRHDVRVEYRFDDGGRIGERRGTYATLRLASIAPGGEIPWKGAPPAPIVRALGWTADALVVATGLLLLAFWLAVVRRSALALLIGLAAAFTIAVVPAAALPGRGGAFALLSAGLVGCTMRVRHARVIRVAAGVAVAVAIVRASMLFPRLDAVLLRSPDNDWLFYEAYARQILETRTLEGGEPIYYFATLARYLKFAEHALVGDSDALVTALVLVLLNVSLLWCCRRAAATRATAAGRWLAGVAGVLAAVLVNAPLLVGFVQHGLSEYAAWVALPAAYAVLLSRRPRPVTGGVLLGLIGLARTNLAPGLLLIAVPWTRLREWRAWTAPLLFVAMMIAVPLSHNRCYGGRWVLVSDAIQQNVVIDPREADRLVTDPAARAAAADAARWILFVGGSNLIGRAWGDQLAKHFHVRDAGDLVEGWTMALPIHGLQVVYILTAIHVLRKKANRTLTSIALLSVPVAFLGPHLFYRVVVYYPRYIIAGYLAMGLAAMWVGVEQMHGRGDACVARRRQ